MKAPELQQRLKLFAYRTVNVTDHLPPCKLSRIIEDQLLRSSFSAAANYRAACNAISKKSFISKLSIAFEESDESLFWLQCIVDNNLLNKAKMDAILRESIELASILAASRKSAQNNLQNASSKKSP